jgi:hypothetical protein
MLGDFNLIYQAEDKNNSNLNCRLMGSFKDAIDDLRLKEIKLNGRSFTWSNEQDNPTMTRIDRLLCTPEWELIFLACFFTHFRLSCHTTRHYYCRASWHFGKTHPSVLKIFGQKYKVSKN